MRRKAAEMLGISLKTLYNRLNVYQAEDAAKAGGSATPVPVEPPEEEETPAPAALAMADSAAAGRRTPA